MTAMLACTTSVPSGSSGRASDADGIEDGLPNVGAIGVLDDGEAVGLFGLDEIDIVAGGV